MSEKAIEQNHYSLMLLDRLKLIDSIH